MYETEPFLNFKVVWYILRAFSLEYPFKTCKILKFFKYFEEFVENWYLIDTLMYIWYKQAFGTIQYKKDVNMLQRKERTLKMEVFDL